MKISYVIVTSTFTAVLGLILILPISRVKFLYSGTDAVTIQGFFRGEG